MFRGIITTTMYFNHVYFDTCQVGQLTVSLNLLFSSHKTISRRNDSEHGKFTDKTQKLGAKDDILCKENCRITG